MRVLLLSTYPAVNPLHGGQHRLAQIAKMLEASGHLVDLRGILGSASYAPRAGYLTYPGDETLSRYLLNPALMEDWAIGKYAVDPAGGFGKLSTLCDDDYDIIFCEQPWLFEFAHKRFAKAKRPPALVYGSQNIEHRLKQEIAKQYFTTTLAERYGKLVEETERFAATNSRLNVAVSDHDRDWLTSFSSAPVVVAANGVMDRRAVAADIYRSNEITGHRKFALYCASGHPPNIKGFYDIFSRGVGCLAPDQILVVAGSAGPAIVGDSRFEKSSGLARKIVAPGEVSETQLRGLLATAHLIILPITTGGGTNLKTAEALWSGEHIVATTTAMRGFESFSSTRGLTVADEPPAFQAAIEWTMREPALQLLATERAERSSVLWPSSLSALATALNQHKGAR